MHLSRYPAGMETGKTAMNWEQVDVGWGRRAPEAAYLFENMHWREYHHILEQTGVTQNTRHLDIACGSGLAIQLASERGAMSAHIHRPFSLLTQLALALALFHHWGKGRKHTMVLNATAWAAILGDTALHYLLSR